MAKSYKSGKFNVSDGHVLNYELFGNPNGTPIIYLHGGPGSGFNEKYKRFFDPRVHNVLLLDQRGAGKSTPYASLFENNTQKLVQDVKDILDFVGFKKVILFGGSWGSTLALVFALKYPEYVSGMILWGIFLGTKDNIDFYYYGRASSRFFPEVWERFISFVPEKERKDNIIGYYLKRMTDDSKKADKYAFEWAYYESYFLKLKRTEKQVLEDLNDLSYRALSPLEAHYMVNNCFLPDNYILKNASELSKIPTSIIHGRYDFCCQPANAYYLSREIKNSRLFFELAGHSARDKAIEKRIISELGKLCNKLKR